MRREGQAAEEPLPLLSCGTVSPALASNVLAEVCEFDSWGEQRRASQGELAPPEDGVDEKSPARRRWTSPDDGWGLNLPMQELEKMPMGMPVTVGELADFLAHACSSSPSEAMPKDGADNAPQRWADPVGEPTAAKASEENRCSAEGCSDMFDWSLAQWRAHRLKLSGHKALGEAPARSDFVHCPSCRLEWRAPGPDGGGCTQCSGKLADGSLAEAESASRLFVEERPRFCGPVLVHRVPLAPPRPILCTDDPEASLLKAVELLLCYPELNALPIVSPVRCTVVAHLTLSYCLAYTLGRMRGSDLLPLANLTVNAQDGVDGGTPAHRVFDSASAPEHTDCWAERRAPAVGQSPWVLRRSQPLHELLAFFARTNHSGVPVVEDGGGVVGLLSRRDLLHFLDLAMQSARRCNDKGAGASLETDNVAFDATAPIEVMVETLQRYRVPLADEGTSAGAMPGGLSGIGATLIYEQNLPLKALLLRMLGAENRKLIFVQDTGNGSPPRLLRVLSVGDVWHLLIGDRSQEAPERTGETAEGSLEVTDT